MTTEAPMSTTQSASIDTVKKTSFSSDVLKLVSGTTFAQLLGVLTAPLLARLYAPEAFGTLAVFVSIISILSVVSCLRYELAIVLPKDNGEAINLFAVCIGFSVLVSLLSLLIIWWGHESILYWLNIPELASYLWLIPIVLLFGGLNSGHPALNYWATRTQRFKELSVMRIMSTTVTVGAQLGSAIAGFPSAGSLIGSSAFGAIVTPIVVGRNIWKVDRKQFLEYVNWQDMLSAIKRYRKFPLYDTWSALLNTASWQLPVIILSSFFTSTIVGYYALGYRMLQLPMSLIGSAIAQVFFQRVSRSLAPEELRIIVDNTFQHLVTIGLFPMLTLTIIGQDIFVIAFGPSWREAGTYVQLLSIWAFFWFISSPLSTVFTALEKQEFLFKFNLMNFITRFIALYIGGFIQEPRFAIFLFSSTGILVYSYLTLSILSEVGVCLRKTRQTLVRSLLTFLPAGSVMLYLLIIGVRIELRLLASGLLLISYYFFLSKFYLTIRSTYILYFRHPQLDE